MTSKRQDLYKKEKVNTHKEVDMLKTKLPFMKIKNYTTFTVPQYCLSRPDLISYINYDTVDFWWLIMQYNGIIDPHSEICIGTVLKIPSLSEYYQFYNVNSEPDDDEASYEVRRLDKHEDNN